MTPAPILVSVYTRLLHFQNTIRALQQNELAKESELFIVSDGPAKVEHAEAVAAVRLYAQTITGFKSVHFIFRSENQGMFKSIISAHTELLDRYGKLIFLEDDIQVAPGFLSYLNRALEYYKNDTRIFSVHGYSYPVDYPIQYPADLFLFPRYNPWGVGLWKDRWKKVDFDESQLDHFFSDKKAVKKFIQIQPGLLPILEKKMQAADALISYHMFKNNLQGVYPIRTQTLNRGFDNSGQHCTDNPLYAKQAFSLNTSTIDCVDLQVNTRLIKKLRSFFGYPTFSKRISNKVERWIQNATHATDS